MVKLVIYSSYNNLSLIPDEKLHQERKQAHEGGERGASRQSDKVKGPSSPGKGKPSCECIISLNSVEGRNLCRNVLLEIVLSFSSLIEYSVMNRGFSNWVNHVF